MTQTVQIFVQLGRLNQNLGRFLGILDSLNATWVKDLVPVDISFVRHEQRLQDT